MKLRHKLILTSLLFLPLFVGFLGVFSTQKANAVSAGDWRPGRIIDDLIFFNKSSMTVAQIQAFLDAKVPVCDRWRASSNPNYQPPYTCLKEYQENTATGESNYGRFNPDGSPLQIAGGKSAAQIIWEEAQNYNINPQTLLVMLQKEQSLITDDWPWLIQYQKAMGQSCPDTAPCDPAFAGFYNQVSGAAWQLRHYINHPDWFNYRAGVTRFVLYNPNSNCGGTNVFIENNATAALYNYTPYQPNTAALNNMYGTGDGCSSYGNRNFWRLFNDWFGSTSVPGYYWEWAGQAVYTDQTKAIHVDTSSVSLTPGERYYAVVRAKNIGTATWHKGNFRLGTTSPLNNSSVICDATWINCGRPATLIEDSVAPGQTGTFEFWIKAPGPGVDLKIYFNPLQESVAWLNDYRMHFIIKTGTLAWQWQGQNVYSDQTKTGIVDQKTMSAGVRYYATLRAKNSGTATWYKNSVKLGTSAPLNHISPLCDATWINCGRPATLIEDSVAPGQTGTFEFWIQPKIASANIKAYFNLLQENIAWFNDIGMHYNLQTGGYSWQWQGQFLYTDASKEITVNPAAQSLTPGQKYYSVLKAKNTGTSMWYKGNLRLGTSSPLNRTSPLCDASTWINCGRPATLVENSIAPGETGTFEFWITAPATSTEIKDYFNLLQENVVWLNDYGMHIIIQPNN